MGETGPGGFDCTMQFQGGRISVVKTGGSKKEKDFWNW